MHKSKRSSLHCVLFASSVVLSLASCEAPLDDDTTSPAADGDEEGGNAFRTATISCWEAVGATPYSQGLPWFKIYSTTATDCSTTPAGTVWIKADWNPSQDFPYEDNNWVRVPSNDWLIYGSIFRGEAKFAGTDSGGRKLFRTDHVDPSNGTPWQNTPPQAAVTPLSVTLKAFTQPYFLAAQFGGGYWVEADRTAAGGWEHFTLRDLNGGQLLNGDYVTLQAYNGNYLAAEGGGGAGSILNANRTAPHQWETFRLLNRSGHQVHQIGDLVTLQSFNLDTVGAVNGGGGSGSGSVKVEYTPASSYSLFYLGL